MKKTFEKPELTILFFEDEDIITASTMGQRYGANGDEWQDEDL